MKIILKSILILSLLSCGMKKLITSNYYGNPSKVIITIDNVKYKDSNRIEKQKLVNSIEYFNKLDQLIKTELLNVKNDSIERIIYYIYDKNGNKISKINSKKGENDFIEYFKYDKFGNLIQHQKSTLITFYTYNTFGKVQKVKSHYPSGHFFEDVEYIYDDKKNKIQMTSFDSIGQIKSSSKWTYYTNGSVKEHQSYNSMGELKWFTKSLKYDEMLNRTSWENYNIINKDTILKDRYSESRIYDSFKNIVLDTVFHNGLPITIGTFKYIYNN